MGFEYSCTPTSELTQATIGEVKDLIVSCVEWVQVKTNQVETNQVEINAATPNVLYLRFADSPIREDWPEDIVLMMSKTRIYVLFHSGHQAKAHFFLSTLQNLWLSKGVTCLFHDE